VAPLRLGGLRGKQSTPSVWLGGTGEPSAVGERERQGERTRHGARDVFRSGRGQRYDFNSGKIVYKWLVLNVSDVLLKNLFLANSFYKWLVLICFWRFVLFNDY
jgi:hypothetical protein